MAWISAGYGGMRGGGRVAAGALAAWCLLAAAAHAEDDAQLARGRYLVTLGSCIDCHTPGYFVGKPDMNRYLGGSDVGFAVPGVGVFVGRNLTPDKETGLGSWTQAQIVTAITTGVRPDGRTLAPVMPWPALSRLTSADASAIAAYLQSLPPVKRQVPGPFGPGEAVSAVMVLDVLPAEVHNSLAQRAAAPSPANE